MFRFSCQWLYPGFTNEQRACLEVRGSVAIIQAAAMRALPRCPWVIESISQHGLDSWGMHPDHVFSFTTHWITLSRYELWISQVWVSGESLNWQRHHDPKEVVFAAISLYRWLHTTWKRLRMGNNRRRRNFIRCRLSFISTCIVTLCEAIKSLSDWREALIFQRAQMRSRLLARRLSKLDSALFSVIKPRIPSMHIVSLVDVKPNETRRLESELAWADGRTFCVTVNKKGLSL